MGTFATLTKTGIFSALNIAESDAISFSNTEVAFTEINEVDFDTTSYIDKATGSIIAYEFVEADELL